MLGLFMGILKVKELGTKAEFGCSAAQCCLGVVHVGVHPALLLGCQNSVSHGSPILPALHY